MCGIAGWSLRPGASLAPEALEAMAGAIRHHGPDHHDTWLSPQAGVGLTHNRLSIRGRPSAHAQRVGAGAGLQRRDLQLLGPGPELERAGHAFHSRTDSEVVLRGFEA